MTAATPIDASHAAFAAAEAGGLDDAGLRMAFYGQVMTAELHVLLEAEPEGDRVRPLVLETEAGRVVLAFDLPERVAAFLDAPRDTITLSGRALVTMLAGQGIGIALNAEVAPSASVIGAGAVDWLAGEAGRDLGAPRQMRIRNLRPPSDMPQALIEAIAARLGAFGGRVEAGFLAAAGDKGGESERLLLALSGVPQAGEAAIAAAVDEAVRFSGLEGVRLDVVFPAPAMLARIERVAIAFRPEPPAGPAPPRAPGTDPEEPPRLR